MLYGELKIVKCSRGGREVDAGAASGPPSGISTYRRGRGSGCAGQSRVAGPRRRGASEYEAKRISEAERKRAQREGGAEASLRSSLVLSATDNLELE